MDILDLLDEEATRIQYDTMMPTPAQQNGAYDFYEDDRLARALDQKIDSHFVIATVSLPDSEESDDNDDGIQDIVNAIKTLQENLSSSISNINLGFSDRFEVEQNYHTESISILEKIFSTYSSELRRQERDRLMSVRPDIQPNDLSVSTNMVQNLPSGVARDDASDDAGFSLPDWDLGGSDDRRRSNGRRGKWLDRLKDVARKIPHSKKDLAKYAVTTAIVGGGIYAYNREDDVASPSQNIATKQDPWNYNKDGSPKEDLSNLSTEERISIENYRKSLWENEGKTQHNSNVMDPTSGSILTGLVGTSAVMSMLPTPSMPSFNLPFSSPSPQIPTPANMLALPPPANANGMLQNATPSVNVRPSTFGKLAQKGNIVANVALGGLDAYSIYNDDKLATKEKTVELSGVGGSILGGIAAGAGTGALLGSMGVPGFGTAIGGFLGAVAGGIVGEKGVEAITSSIYDFFEDDEVVHNLETQIDKTSKANIGNITEEAEESSRSLEEVAASIEQNYVNVLRKQSLLDSAEKSGKSYAVDLNTKLTRSSNGSIVESPIPRVNRTRNALTERQRFVAKLKPKLKSYAEARNVPKRAVDTVIAAFSNPALTFKDSTVIAQDVLADPEFNPLNIMANNFIPSPLPKANIINDLIAETSYPVTNMNTDSSRENFVQVSEIKASSQYDHVVPERDVATDKEPKPTNKRKVEKPATRTVYKQAPLSINLIDNLQNQAGLNYIGTTYG